MHNSDRKKPTEYKHFNFEQLMSLDQFSGPDESLAHSVLTLYLETAPQQIDEITKLSSIKSFDSIRKIAHGLKSSSAHFGATEVMRFSEEVELFIQNTSTLNNETQAESKLQLMIENLVNSFALLLNELKELHPHLDSKKKGAT